LPNSANTETTQPYGAEPSRRMFPSELMSIHISGQYRSTAEIRGDQHQRIWDIRYTCQCDSISGHLTELSGVKSYSAALSSGPARVDRPVVFADMNAAS
jgi:hypothetical protein